MGQVLSPSPTQITLKNPDGYPIKEYKVPDATYLPHTVFKANDTSTKPYMLMGKHYPCATYGDMSKIQTLLEQRKYLNGDNCLTLVDHYSIDTSNYGAYWEYPLHTLERECLLRRASPVDYVKQTKYFSDPEAWAFIRMLTVLDLEYTRKFSRFFGDIQPRLIMVSQQGTMFFNDILNFTPHQENGYKRVLRTPRTFSALSPEACKEVSEFRLSPTYDENKNEVFAIAITVLAVISDFASIDDAFQNFYISSVGPKPMGDTTGIAGNKMQVNLPAIQSALEKLVRVYRRSPLLVDTLRVMLNPNEKERPNLLQILEFLKLATA